MKAIFTASLKSALTLTVGTLISFSASANDFAAAIGFRSNSADAVTVGADVTSKTSLGAGVIGFFDMGDSFQIRSGFLYNQRHFGLGATGGTDYETNAAYIDIPVTAMFKFADYAGAFAGPVLGLLASKECKVPGGCATSPESTLMALQFGASFKFAPQLGAEIYYETVPSTFWKDAMKNARTVGANLLFTFE
jgi:hypothetical protein